MIQFLADGGLCDSIRVLSLDWWPQPEVAIAAEGQFCTGESVVLRSANAGTAYQWSTGATGAEVEVFEPGLYYLTLTDAQGCTALDSILLEANSLSGIPDWLAPPCFGEAGGLIQLDSVQGGTPPYLAAFMGRYCWKKGR